MKISISGGDVKISSASAGTSGVSGDLFFRTGDTTSRFDPKNYGHSGSINMITGSAHGFSRGGGINIFASTNSWSHHTNVGDIQNPTEINFGFDEVSGASTKRQVSLQLTKFKNSTRLALSVPLQVTMVQYSSDKRIKKEITAVDTGDLLDRMRLVELRKYGYSDEWRHYRGIDNDVRVRGVVAQELYKVFPEHVQILNQLATKDPGPKFNDFHQVDKQGLVLDCEFQNHSFLLSIFFCANDFQLQRRIHNCSDWGIQSAHRSLPSTEACWCQNKTRLSVDSHRQ